MRFHGRIIWSCARSAYCYLLTIFLGPATSHWFLFNVSYVFIMVKYLIFGDIVVFCVRFKRVPVEVPLDLPLTLFEDFQKIYICQLYIVCNCRYYVKLMFVVMVPSCCHHLHIAPQVRCPTSPSLSSPFPNGSPPIEWAHPSPIAVGQKMKLPLTSV